MTAADMIAELEALTQRDNERDGFFTTEEMAYARGVGSGTIHKWLKAAERAGRLEHREFRKPNIRGRLTTHAGYRILPP